MEDGGEHVLPLFIMARATKKTLDKFSLASVLHDVFYYGKSDHKEAIEKLKKSKHITPTGKLSKTGTEFISRWFARGADRETLMKELD